MKKIISVLLAAALCVSMLVFPASAAMSIKISRSQKNGYTQVKLSCEGYTLRYTLDGSAPDGSSKKYTKAIKVTEPSQLRVAAFKNGKKSAELNADIDVRVKAPSAKRIKKTEKKLVYKITVPEGATVYVTNDGSTPSKSNNIAAATGSFKMTIRENGVYKLRAYKDGWKDSKTRSIKVSSLEKDGDAYYNAQDTEFNEFEEEVLRLVNVERRKAGLTELKSKPKLSEAAQIRAKELAKKFDHNRPDGSSCFTVFNEVGLKRTTSGENIAAGMSTPADVVKAWMNSSGHRANILNPKFHYMGVGFYRGGGFRYNWVQLFTS